MMEKRRYERVAFFHQVQVTVLPGGPTVVGNSFDISIGGVGISAPIWLDRGQDVRVRFHWKKSAHEGIDEDILGRIAYGKAELDGNRLGIEFMEPVQEKSHPLLSRAINRL